MIKIKEKYNTKNKNSEENKIICNRLFTREAIQNIGNALILDAEDLRTTTWLNRRGFVDITVPNPYIYDKIKKDIRIMPFNMFIGDYMKRITYKTFTTVWLDYCCTYGGNIDMKPKEDIEYLFDTRMFENNSILAVTFCSRKGTKAEYPDEDFGKSIACITNEAKINNYTAVYLRHHKYKGMFFQMFKIFKNT